MDFKSIRYEKQDRIVVITLNRPEVLNALTHEMMLECGQAWRMVEADDDVWVAVVTGAGRGFCTGADVKDAARRVEDGDFFMRIDSATPEHKGWGPRRYKVTKPVICAVNGIACGGGLDFISESDIVICSENTEFFDSHVSIGWASAHEGVELARRIPLGEALMMELLGSHYRMSAQRAYQIGLVQLVVPQERLMETAMDLAGKIARNAPIAVRATKEGIWRSLGLPLDEANQIAASYLYINTHMDDFREGPRAWFEKREPRWTGKGWVPFQGSTP